MLLMPVAALLLMFGLYKFQTEHVFEQAIYAKNTSRIDIPLYPENPKLIRPLGVFKSGATLPLKYSGTSGTWHYLDLAGKTVSIRGAELVTGYLYNERWFVSQKLMAYLNYPLDYIIYASVGLLVLILVLLASMLRMRVVGNRIQLYEKENEYFRRQAMQASEKQKMLEVKVRHLQTSLIVEQKGRESEIAQVNRASLNEKEQLKLQRQLKHQIASKQLLEDEIYKIQSELKIEKQSIPFF